MGTTAFGFDKGKMFVSFGEFVKHFFDFGRHGFGAHIIIRIGHTQEAVYQILNDLIIALESVLLPDGG